MPIWKDRRPHKAKGRLATVVTVVSVASKDAAVSLGLPVVDDNESDGPAGRPDSSPPSLTPRRRVSAAPHQVLVRAAPHRAAPPHQVLNDADALLRCPDALPLAGPAASRHARIFEET